jgi:hypothetical protein
MDTSRIGKLATHPAPSGGGWHDVATLLAEARPSGLGAVVAARLL